MSFADDPSVEDWATPPPSVRADSVVPADPRATGPLGHVPPGTIIGTRYRVTKVLGAGGFGVVYEAEHIQLRRAIALKVLHPELTRNATQYERFQQEARTAAAIGHPNIVQVFDLGHDERGAYIAMEKLDGEELEDRIVRDHPLPEAWVARVGADIADAVASAHDAGVIHRDLKPQNVVLARQGRRRDVVKLIDFGIAKLVDHRLEGDLTKSGQLFGTPRYMAPEQFRGSRGANARSDVYAIGAILYRALTGAYPFDAQSYPELLLTIMTDPIRPVRERRPDISERMAWIVETAMAKQPDDRFASARELADALSEHADRLDNGLAPTLPPVPPPPPRADSAAPAAPSSARASSRPVLLLLGGAAALVVLVLGAAGLYYALGSGPEAPAPAAHAAVPAPFTVHVTATPADAEMVLDGITLGHGALTRELPRNGVPHQLLIRAEGHVPESLTFTDAPPSRDHIELTPIPVAEPEPATPEPTPLPEPTAEVEPPHDVVAAPAPRAAPRPEPRPSSRPRVTVTAPPAEPPRWAPPPAAPSLPRAAPSPAPAPTATTHRRGANAAPIVY